MVIRAGTTDHQDRPWITDHQYNEGGVENVDPINFMGAGFGTANFLSNGLMWAGVGGKALPIVARFSGWGGVAIGTIQSWQMVYQPFNDLNNWRPTTGNFHADAALARQYDEGIYNELDYFR